MLRSRHIISGLVLAAVVAASSLSGSATAQTPPPGSYLKTFDNYVTTDPLRFGPSSDMDVLVHSRDSGTWAGLEPMAIEHGPHCEAPPATHQSPNLMPYEDAVFICAANPHLMTAMKASGYGLVYLTPGAVADWTDGETVIRMDVSTLRNSGRDWWDVWVTPFDDLMAAPLDDWLPDLQGLPRRGIHVRMDSSSGKTMFRFERIDGHIVADLGSCWWCGYEDVIVPSASRRDTFELRISQTGARWAILNGSTGQPLMTWVDHTWATPLGWTSGVVQIGHHSYNPEKDCANPGTVGCRAGTWHWDNISISRMSPMTIVPARERRANATQPTYTFAEPAPEGATLHVLALADQSLEVSTDGGATWMLAQKRFAAAIHWGGRASYVASVPAGTTAVTLRGVDQTGNPWDANHAAIYSQQPRKPQASTPTLLPPTNTPIPTETPVPTFTPGPTSTPEPLLTSTPTVGVSATPTFQPDTTPTPIPANAEACVLTRGGTPVATWRCD